MKLRTTLYYLTVYSAIVIFFFQPDLTHAQENNSTQIDSIFKKAYTSYNHYIFKPNKVLLDSCIFYFTQLKTALKNSENWNEYFNTSIRLFLMHRKLGHTQQSLEEFQTFLETLNSHFGTDSIITSKAELYFKNSGWLHNKIFLDSAKYYNTLSKDLSEKTSDWDQYLQTSLNLYYLNQKLFSEDFAIENLKKSISVFKSHSKDLLKLEKASYILSTYYYKKGYFSEANNCIFNLLDLQVKTYGKYSSKVAFTYLYLGNKYLNLARIDSAIVFFNKHIEIANKIGLTPVTSYNKLSSCYELKGNYQKAAEYLQKAIDYSRKKNEPNNLSTYLNNLGNIYFKMGNYNLTLKCYEEAIYYQKMNSEINYNTANLYRSLSAIYFAKGDYINGFLYIDKSIDIQNQNSRKNFSLLCSSYWVKSYEYMKLNDFQNSFKNLTKVQEILQSGLCTYRDSLNVYSLTAELYYRKGDYDSSLIYFKKIDDFYSQKNPFIARQSNYVYVLIGKVYLAKKEYNKALEYFNKSLDNYVSSSKIPVLAEAYNLIGEAYYGQSLYVTALNYFDKAAACLGLENIDGSSGDNQIINSSGDKIILLQAIENQTKVYKTLFATTGNLKYLHHLNKRYLIITKLLSDLKQNLEAEDSKFYWAEKSFSLFQDAINTSIELYKKTKENSFLENAFYLSEESKTTILLNSLNDVQAKKFAGIPDSLVEEEANLKGKINTVNRLISFENEQNYPDSLKLIQFNNQVFDFNQKSQELTKYFENNYPKYFKLKYQTNSIALKEIQKKIEPDDAIIEYSFGKSSLNIFVITSDQFNEVTSPIDSGFNMLVNSYNELLNKKVNLIRTNNKSDFFNISRKLYNYLIAPVEKYISAKVNLMVVPSGILYNLPFETLLYKNNNSLFFSKKDYLLKRFNIYYNYSVNLAFNFEHKRKYPNNMFIGFAPSFNNNEIASLNPQGLLSELTYSKNEVDTIAALFKEKNKSAQTFINGSATEKIFKKITNNSSGIIHIATHSFVNKEDPNLSGLIFSSQKDDSSEDGILYADEIYNLKMNCSLVVLSSCESGIGKFINGEGVLALDRGFIYAGVTNLVFSLWKVSDKQTYSLMTEFYKNILSGQSYKAALRNAKLKMLDNEFTALPDSWSSFVLLGN